MFYLQKKFVNNMRDRQDENCFKKLFFILTKKCF